ncbi:hypothetical protein ACFL6W_07185 [Thermodesulfobacteriota bacterium]
MLLYGRKNKEYKEELIKTGFIPGIKPSGLHGASIESVLFCDWAFSNLYNADSPDGMGYTPQAEPRFLNGVTYRNHTFEDGIDMI